MAGEMAGDPQPLPGQQCGSRRLGTARAADPTRCRCSNLLRLRGAWGERRLHKERRGGGMAASAPGRAAAGRAPCRAERCSPPGDARQPRSARAVPAAGHSRWWWRRALGYRGSPKPRLPRSPRPAGQALHPDRVGWRGPRVGQTDFPCLNSHGPGGPCCPRALGPSARACPPPPWPSGEPRGTAPALGGQVPDLAPTAPARRAVIFICVLALSGLGWPGHMPARRLWFRSP